MLAIIHLQYLFGPVQTGHSPVLRPSLIKKVPLELQSLSSPQITEKQMNKQSLTVQYKSPMAYEIKFASFFSDAKVSRLPSKHMKMYLKNCMINN